MLTCICICMHAQIRARRHLALTKEGIQARESEAARTGVCVYIYIHIYICMYVCIYIVRAYTHRYIQKKAFRLENPRQHVQVCVCVYIYIYMYVYT